MSKLKTSSDRSGGGRRIVVLTAPSGSGKTSIARRVLESLPDLRFSVSVTTRPMRHYERQGIDYFFVSPEQFHEFVDAGELLEYEEVYPGRFYGTLKEEVDLASEDGPVLLDVDVRGALNVKEVYGDDALVIFIRPPSVEELERRLTLRGSEDPFTLADRINKATFELEYEPRFDEVVVNEDLEHAVHETLELIRSFLGSDAN